MRNRQTAVEWLHEKLAQSSQEELVGNINLWFKQSKEMEKQQIIDAYSEGDVNGIMNNEMRAEQYYNEQFNK